MKYVFIDIIDFMFGKENYDVRFVYYWCMCERCFVI